MKSILALALLAVSLTSAPCAFAEQARTMTKGTKTYQSARPVKPSEKTAVEQQDPSRIEPAAGNDLNMPETTNEKSFKEQMRLPRKN